MNKQPQGESDGKWRKCNKKKRKKKTIEVVRALRAEGLLRMEALDLALP